MIELRVLIPKSVIRPTKDPIVSHPPEKKIASTPPARANGRFASTRTKLRKLPNAMASKSMMPTPAIGDERCHVTAAHVRADGLPPPRRFVEHDVASRSLIDVRQLPERNASALRIVEHETSGILRSTPCGRVQDHVYRKRAVTFVGLRNGRSLICRLHSVHDRDGLEAELKQAFGT